MNALQLSEKAAILLVDDRPENLTALEALLGDLGVETARALSGNDALLLTLKHDFALVLLDVQMPLMDGFETAELMRSNPKTRHLPIIFITAGMKETQHQFKGYDAGAVDYLAKPVEPMVLRSKVRVFRDLYLQRRELEIHRQHLQTLVDQRTSELRKAAQELEQRVIDRTLELQQVNQQLEAFAYSVSHDLRAPLRHIDNFSQILMNDYADRLDEEARRVLKRIVAGCDQMGQLIDSILALSRTARQPINKIVVNPERIARGVYEELTTGETRLAMTFLTCPLPECLADPILLKQVLVNLISNAIKYSKKTDSPRIEVGCSLDTGTPVYFVRDNGIGFDMQYADKLFAVFQRLHCSSEFEGTGVGLAIVQNIIQRHGGKIWAETEVNKGATFFFTL
jgi:two-component system sensor histidine kinase/response regulator